MNLKAIYRLNENSKMLKMIESLLETSRHGQLTG